MTPEQVFKRLSADIFAKSQSQEELYDSLHRTFTELVYLVHTMLYDSEVAALSTGICCSDSGLSHGLDQNWLGTCTMELVTLWIEYHNQSVCLGGPKAGYRVADTEFFQRCGPSIATFIGKTREEFGKAELNIVILNGTLHLMFSDMLYSILVRDHARFSPTRVEALFAGCDITMEEWLASRKRVLIK